MGSERSNYAATTVSEERVGEVCRSGDSPAACDEAVFPQPMEINGGAGTCLQSVEDPTLEQVTVPEEGHDSEGSPH